MVQNYENQLFTAYLRRFMIIFCNFTGNVALYIFPLIRENYDASKNLNATLLFESNAFG